MADLRSAFESAGHSSVRTYIQSGNVLFDSDRPRRDLEGQLETALEERFGVPLVVVVRSHRQIRNTVRSAPDGFGTQPETYHSDAVFLKAPLTARRAMRVVALRDGVDRAWPGRRRHLLRTTQRSADPQPDEQHHRHPRVPADDDPQLVDHDQAAGAARRAERGLTGCRRFAELGRRTLDSSSRCSPWRRTGEVRPPPGHPRTSWRSRRSPATSTGGTTPSTWGSSRRSTRARPSPGGVEVGGRLVAVPVGPDRRLRIRRRDGAGDLDRYRADRRGEGNGTLLLTALISEAGRRRIPGLSLSVESDNPAIRLVPRAGLRRGQRRGRFADDAASARGLIPALRRQPPSGAGRPRSGSIVDHVEEHLQEEGLRPSEEGQPRPQAEHGPQLLTS